MATLPTVNTEDQPPMLRFVQGSKPDVVKTQKTGKPQFMNIIKVYVSAHGDIKNVVPYVAEKTAYDEHVIKTTEEKEVLDYVEGKEEAMFVKKQVPVEKREYTPRIANPWLDYLRDQLKGGFISQGYYDHCIAAFNAFKKNMSIPEDGVPLGDWTGFLNEAVKRKAIEIGINTVEKAAVMTEQAMEAIGMGARDMKNKARAYVEADRDKEKMADSLLRMERQIQDRDDQLSALQQKIAELESKKRGKKDEAEAA